MALQPLLPQSRAGMGFSSYEIPQRPSHVLFLHWENKIFGGPDLAKLWWVTCVYYLHFFNSVM